MVVSRHEDGALNERDVANPFAVLHLVTVEQRARRHGHHGGVVWLTGLSGAGKSTLAMRLERLLFELGWQAYVLDGDNLRQGLCAGLGFSADDRSENVRRLGEVASLFADAGVIAVVSAISPYRSDRERVRRGVGRRFCEVFVDAPLAVCERRDPKGLYEKARARRVLGFTGVSAPYDAPARPELRLDTENATPEASAATLFAFVQARFALKTEA